MHEVPVDLTKATIMAPHTDNGSAGWTTPGRIPEAAVEAAAIRLYGKHRKDDRALRRLTFLALDAAAPHMLASLAKEIGSELQDAPPSNYEEDNYDAGYIAGLAYAQDLLRAAMRPIL